MLPQNQIKRTLSQPDAIAYVAEALILGECAHRSALADLVCERFGFFDPRGQAQIEGCLKALRELEASGHFKLPAAQGKPGPSNALSSSCANAQAVAGGCARSDGRAHAGG